MILRVQVGSGVHGTALSGQDDRDEMGICLEPARFVTGLARVPSGVDGGVEKSPRLAAWHRSAGVTSREL
ncbi:Predicted nucleotidyltransferase [Tessaracoccus bendigoensis DSM 12906]|uniref:Predicted nucleotidyltransferase n=1 Tax=Tessaracoccus bendigoensis DSM 12906 TaxID=1123357 RepID=A0A1M6D6A7_9ACTN|nr:Predicted nucleotidyltransferase [Tessaracoccus bendigoensis DSM 12906]